MKKYGLFFGILMASCGTQENGYEEAKNNNNSSSVCSAENCNTTQNEVSQYFTEEHASFSSSVFDAKDEEYWDLTNGPNGNENGPDVTGYEPPTHEQTQKEEAIKHVKDLIYSTWKNESNEITTESSEKCEPETKIVKRSKDTLVLSSSVNTKTDCKENEREVIEVGQNYFYYTSKILMYVKCLSGSVRDISDTELIKAKADNACVGKEVSYLFKSKHSIILAKKADGTSKDEIISQTDGFLMEYNPKEKKGCTITLKAPQEIKRNSECTRLKLTKFVKGGSLFGIENKHKEKKVLKEEIIISKGFENFADSPWPKGSAKVIINDSIKADVTLNKDSDAEFSITAPFKHKGTASTQQERWNIPTSSNLFSF